MLISKDLAAQMEACIKQTHIEVTRQYKQGTIMEISGGAACFSGFDSYLSQVVGWGFATKAKHFKAEIERIEQFYKELKHQRVDIELCPFTGNELAVFLSKRGYGVSELNNVSVLALHTSSLRAQRSNPEVQSTTLDCFAVLAMTGQLNKWAKSVALGFDYPEAQEQFLHYAQSKGVTAFAVYDGDNIVAGATIAMHGDFCDLGVTSVLPAFRGKGLQKKLLHARLNFAKEHGLSWATVTTEPGSVSDQNIQKVGFCCAYTRVKMTLE